MFFSYFFIFFLFFNEIFAINVKFPLNFSTKLEIVNHLIHPSSSSPQSSQFYQIFYDYKNKKSKITLERGNEISKTFIRRYDQKKEYMLRNQPILDCKYSFLGEEMELPHLFDLIYEGIEEIEVETDLKNKKENKKRKIIKKFHSYVFEEYDTRVEMIFDPDTWMPSQLDLYKVEDSTSKAESGKEQCLNEEDSEEKDSQSQESITLMPITSYIFSESSLDPIDPSVFELDQDYQELDCLHHLGGFPYIHIFHYFLRI